MLLRRLLIAALLVAPLPALAQTSQNANVVASCGTPNSTYSANQNAPVTQDTAGKECVNAVLSPPSPITPIISTAAESSHILKASAGNLVDAYVTAGSTAGYLMVFNATSAPADGAVTPQDCIQVPANTTQSLFTGGAPYEMFSTGITAVFSTTGCFTKTASATAFFHGRVQ